MPPSSKGSLASAIFIAFLINGAASASLKPKTGQVSQLDPITTEDILSGKLVSKSLNAEWDPELDPVMRITTDEAVTEYNVETGATQVLVNITHVKRQLPEGSQFQNLIFSSDGRYALVQHQDPEELQLFPSPENKYDILDVSSGELISQLSPPPEFLPDDNQPSIQAVFWSPTGNGIAFVYNFNIYYRPNPTSSDVWTITTDGHDSENSAIYNGVPDWSYAGVLYTQALWFSPSGERLAFVRFDETNVTQFQFPLYGKPGDEKRIYPEWKKLRYAKSGTRNADATLNFVALAEDGKLRKVERLTLPRQPETQDLLMVGKLAWLNEEQVLLGAFNRIQSSIIWAVCGGGTCRGIYNNFESDGFLDVRYDPPVISQYGNQFLFYENIFQNEEIGSYKHIVNINITSGAKTVLTDGQLHVDRILGWDEPNGLIYFAGTFWNGTVADPTETQIYSVSDSGSGDHPSCLTCDTVNNFGSKCRQNSAKFSKDYTYFIHDCQGPSVPMTTTRLASGGGAVDNPGPSLVTNSELQETLDGKAVPIEREYQVPVGNSSLNFTARVKLYLPPGFDELDPKKYPLLLYVYGGPTNLMVNQYFLWHNSMREWEASLASSSGIILAVIDGRGLPRQSKEFLFENYRKLGTGEIEDQIKVTKWLLDNHDWIDKDKVAVTGHSYGGYSTIKILEKDEDNLFKCGIARAPVTSWRYYYTGYTERYMGLPTPEDNLQGYNEADTTGRDQVENLRNKKLFLIHGTADYNVHYQNSMVLARALQEADILFHEMSYSDEDHGLAKKETLRHLYHSMEDFLLGECFNLR